MFRFIYFTKQKNIRVIHASFARSETVIRKRKAHRSMRPLPHSETVMRKWKSPPHENSLPIFRFLIFKSKNGFTGGTSIAVVTAPKHPLEESCDVIDRLKVAEDDTAFKLAIYLKKNHCI